MPRDVSLSDSKCWNGGHEWVNDPKLLDIEASIDSSPALMTQNASRNGHSLKHYFVLLDFMKYCCTLLGTVGTVLLLKLHLEHHYLYCWNIKISSALKCGA